jgi:hypothetical protein
MYQSVPRATSKSNYSKINARTITLHRSELATENETIVVWENGEADLEGGTEFGSLGFGLGGLVR